MEEEYIVPANPNPNRNNPKYNRPLPEHRKYPPPPCGYDHRGAVMDMKKDENSPDVTLLVCIYCGSEIGRIEDNPTEKRGIAEENAKQWV
jgi:hypothetical protein